MLGVARARVTFVLRPRLGHSADAVVSMHTDARRRLGGLAPDLSQEAEIMQQVGALPAPGALGATA